MWESSGVNKVSVWISILEKKEVENKICSGEKKGAQPAGVNDILRTSSEYLIEPNEGYILSP